MTVGDLGGVAALADLSVAQRFDWRAYSHWQEEHD